MLALVTGALFNRNNFAFMADSGVVINGGGTNPEIGQIAETTPTRGTTGAVLSQALAAYTPDAVGIAQITPVPSQNRVVIADVAKFAALRAILENDGNLIESAQLTRDDPTKRSGPMTSSKSDAVSDVAAAVNARLAPAKPAFNPVSVVNMVEDVTRALGKAVLVLVDQSTQHVHCYTGTPADIDQARANLVDEIGLDLRGILVVDTTPQAATSAQFGE